MRIAAGCAAAIVLSLFALHFHFNLSSITSLQLFLVVAIALRWGFVESSIVSLVSVVCLDFFGTEPLFRLSIADTRDWVALATFEAVALLISSLSDQVNRRGRALELHQSQLQKLYELSQQILLLDREAAVEQGLADLIRSSLQVKGVALWNAYSQRMCRSGECTLSDDEVRAPFDMSLNDDHRNLALSRRVLRLGTRPIGSLILYGHSLDTTTVNAAASLAAVAIERARSFTTAATAEAARQSEQLRAAILDGLAHAFKSPLTTILASSSGLLAMETLSGTEKRLVALIDRHAGILSDLANHLLLTAKLDSGDLKLRRERLDLNELVGSGVGISTLQIEGHVIDLRTAPLPGRVYGDKKLLQMALLQLLDNAVKYGLPGSPIVVGVQEQKTEVHITVTNEGSFIPAEEREKIFQRFYRCPGSARAVSGTGIGLSVVRRIAEAHQGRASVASDHLIGTTFTMALPRMAKEG